MANKVFTVFQNLDKAISGNWDAANHSNTYDMSNNQVIYKTDNVHDYQKTKLELQQNNFLNNRWKKANVDLSISSFSGLNNVKLMYRDADLMDSFPEIGAALDIVSEESCLYEDTKIKLLDGSIKTIKELYDENYTNFWVYSVDENGVCSPSLVECVKHNGIKELYNVTLDDNTNVKCTDNHLWLLSDNTWKRTDELSENDSIMSIYDKKTNLGYEKIKSTTENSFRLTHRIVAENVLRDAKLKLSEINEPYQKIVIHHESFDKLNNDPNFLTYMFWNDHQKLHTDLNSERWGNKEFSDKMRKIFSETNKKTWAEKGDIIKEKLKQVWSDRKLNMSNDELKSIYGRVGEQNGMYDVHRYGDKNPNYNSEKNHIDDISEKEYVDYVITLYKGYRESLMEKFNLLEKGVIDYNQILCKKYGVEKISNLKFVVDDKFKIENVKKILHSNDNLTINAVANSLKVTRGAMIAWLKHNKFNDWEDFVKQAYNHKVLNVEKLNISGNVYDLINSSCNNSFAIKCNKGHVIVHNCITGSKGHIVNVYSTSDRIKNIIEDLFINRLDLQVTAPMIIRAMCKYGNQFMMLNVDNKVGISGWRQLPVFEVERLENGIQNAYSSHNITLNNAKDADLSTKFAWIGSGEAVPFRNWQIGHFRLLTDSIYLPYGSSYLNKARRHWRMLSLMEDMMLIYRLERSIERRVYKIFVGAIDDADVQAYVEDIANNFKRTPIIDPLTGQVDLRKNLLSIDQDIFIPVRDPNAPTPIDTLAAAQNLTAMDDIKFIQNKVLTALRIPKTFLNFEEAAGDGKNLALMDIRFTRTINRIQQAFLMELTKIVTIHLYLLGFEDELTNFSLSMNNPSTQSEQLEIDNLQKKILAVRDAVSDPGNGIPIMSQSRALKEIMKWSDKEIQENLEEIRLEKGIAAEIEKTSQIIKKTGVFDVVDRMYGEPGAEYQDDQMNGENPDDGGMPSGGGGGSFGGGLDDMGGIGDEDMEGDIAGEEGEMPVENVGNDNVDGGGSDEAPQGPPNESNRKSKPLLVESNIRKNKVKPKSCLDIYKQRMDDKSKDINLIERTEIYDKSLMINEEFDDIIKSLNTFIEK